MIGDVVAFRNHVALFTRAWIEMVTLTMATLRMLRRPLHEGVD